MPFSHRTAGTMLCIAGGLWILLAATTFEKHSGWLLGLVFLCAGFVFLVSEKKNSKTQTDQR